MPGPIKHPFLICTREDFPALRQRAEREPWKTMAADALERVAAGPPPDTRAVALQFYLGACALAYILEPDAAPAHAQRVRQAIAEGLAAVAFDPTQQHVGTVPPMGAAFVAILALDLVHDDLCAEELAACEAVIAQQIGRIDRGGAWWSARLGTHGTWDIYKGERTTPDDAFLKQYIDQTTPDGVNTVSPTYAFARLGSGNDRPQKTGYADVLEFTGIDRRYYRHPRLQAFYRWLYSASITPARQYHVFGDVVVTGRVPNAPLLWRVGRFDRQAAAYAAWLLAGKQPPGHLLGYVLMQEPLPEPVVPRSQLFTHGGATLRETPDSPLSLGALLYNITENDEFHTHEEVNAISLAAYGARLLVNGGWLGEGMRPPWKNNTLAINGQRHARRTGAGLQEGMLAEGLDYACGDCGGALGHGSFRRSLILVHGQDDGGGYFITFDDVLATPGSNIHAYLQTASQAAAAAITERAEYRYPVNHHATAQGVAATVFFATPPTAVQQEMVESGFLERQPRAGHHNRLEAVYPVDRHGRCRITTLLFPHDAHHPKARMSRLVADHAVGALVTFGGGVSDVVLQSDGEQPVECEGIAFRAEAMVCRRHGEAPRFYFVRRGRGWRCGGVGFQSDQPVSIFMRGTEGRMVAGSACRITLQHPRIVGVRLDGASVVAAPAAGGLQIDVPGGAHAIGYDVAPDPG